MSREVRRVPLDFDWPLDKVWGGYIRPDKFDEDSCPDCDGGYSAFARQLHDQWYGNAPFRPEDNGRTPYTWEKPAILEFSRRNVEGNVEFYCSFLGIAPGAPGEVWDSTGRTRLDIAVEYEAKRLARVYNSQWSYHLSQQDVDDILAHEPIHKLTHEFVRTEEFTGWRLREPRVTVTADMYNEYMIRHVGSDGLYALIKARCARAGQPITCGTCDGRGSLERYEGQREEAAAWEREQPPAGEGWQLWETVTEGSPVSPVFATAEELAQWLTTPDALRLAVSARMSIEAARRFVEAGWAPTMIEINGAPPRDGVLVVGEMTDEDRA